MYRARTDSGPSDGVEEVPAVGLVGAEGEGLGTIRKKLAPIFRCIPEFCTLVNIIWKRRCMIDVGETYSDTQTEIDHDAGQCWGISLVMPWPRCGGGKWPPCVPPASESVCYITSCIQQWTNNLFGQDLLCWLQIPVFRIKWIKPMCFCILFKKFPSIFNPRIICALNDINTSCEP